MSIANHLLPIACCLLLIATAQAGEAPARDQHGAQKLGWILGLQHWTFHDVSLFETLDHAKALGLTCVEFYPGQPVGEGIADSFDHKSSPEIRAKVKERLASLGLRVMNYGVVQLDGDEVADRRVFDFARDMGIGTIVSEPSDDAFALLDRLVAEYGIRVAIHDHPKPSQYWDPHFVLKAIAGHDARIGSCSDTGHWARSGLVPVDCLTLLEGHVLTLHLKDTDAIAAGAHDVPFGTGKADLPGQLAELKRQGFTGYMSMEYETSASVESRMRDLAESIACFDTVTNALAR